MTTLENVTKTFGDIKALDSVSCKINEGSILGVVGSNGAGKSTMLRLISGVYQKDSGKIMIGEKEVFDNPDIKKHCILIGDNPYYYAGSSMNSMAKVYASFYDTFSYDYYDELIELFKLDPKKQISNFSKGMQRQAIIILALACKCKYILLDETLDGLDHVKRGLVKRKLYESVLDNNSTVIISSHSLRELEDTCDNLVMIHNGKIIFQRDILNENITLSKVQVVLEEDLKKQEFKDIDILKYTRNGSVSNLIVRGDSKKIMEVLEDKNPTLLEIVPLSLEEIFTYELQERGYTFDEVLESDGE